MLMQLKSEPPLKLCNAHSGSDWDNETSVTKQSFNCSHHVIELTTENMTSHNGRGMHRKAIIISLLLLFCAFLCHSDIY